MKFYADYSDIRKDLFSGQITCADIVHHHLTKIKNNQQLNAFLSVYDDEALLRAADIDIKIKSGTAGKLAGLVVGIKDVLAWKDHPLQGGSKILNGFISQYTATAVQRLLDEDAIIIGRQNCDEFGMGSSNENSAFGPVHNAADVSKVSGGSSGGSAVAVQADMCQVSLGSDTGGSVRQPAAFCGIVGLKPTYSRVSRHGLIAYASSFDCIGILSRSVSDAALVLEVIAGADEFDSTVSRRPVDNYPESISSLSEKKNRICYFKNTIENEGIQAEVSGAVKATVEKLKSEGHEIEEVSFDLMDYLLSTYYILTTAEASSNLSRYDGVRFGYRTEQDVDLEGMYKQSRSIGFGKEVQRRILLGTFVLSASYYDAYYTKAQKARNLIRKKIKALFGQYDFILMPSTPTTAFPLGAHGSNPIEMYLADIFTVLANVSGIPAVSIPAGVDNNNLPIGVQLMADDFQESKLLSLAAQLLTKI